MEASVVLVWVGALLIICSVLYGAAKALGRGRLSEARPSPPGAPPGTLEPRRPGAGLGLRSHWPGLALAAVGTLLLLAGAVL